MDRRIPELADLAYHPNKLPKDIAGQVELLSEIMGFDIDLATKRDAYVLNALIGVILYRHLDRVQQMGVMEMLIEPTALEHFTRGDISQLVGFVTDVIIQPRWWLWSLSTSELEILFKEREDLQKLMSQYGIGFTITGGLSAYRAGMSIKNGIPGFVLGCTLMYIQNQNTQAAKNELDLRTSNPKSSPFFNR
ncbi:hypothetical protein [Halioxenophilus aromaticivorans]|uniref:Uncharacterized protein n=1 Tax=Halioxenophilus aromaticivorans TaxID=1306992 RepID=A0AAV3U994_9ALTE